MQLAWQRQRAGGIGCERGLAAADSRASVFRAVGQDHCLWGRRPVTEPCSSTAVCTLSP